VITAGPGQQGTSDAASDFNGTAFVINQILARVRTIVVVQVVASTSDGEIAPPGTVNVTPLVNLVDGLGNATPHGTVFNIPVWRLQGGGNAIIIDPRPGDVGFMGVCDRDISAVKNTKARANPGSERRFALSDGVYLGGLLNAAPEQYVAFTEAGITIADKNGNVITLGPDGIDITAARLTNSGAVIAGFGGADQVTVQDHVHAQGNDTHGDGEVPTDPPTAGT
jgi:hypothetical protein